MRVLQIGLSSNLGGSESFVFNYMEELSIQGVIFDFIDIYGNGVANEKRIKELGGIIYTLKNYKKHPFFVKNSITDIIKENSYSVVHIHLQSAANLIPIQASIDAGIIPIVHSHSSSALGIIRKVINQINVTKLRKYNIFHAACGKKAGDWMWGNTKYTIVPNAINITKYAFSESNRKFIRNSLEIGDDTIVLGYVGRISVEKNPFFMLKIIKWLKNNNVNAQLIIVGSGDLDSEVKKEINNQKLGKNVKLVGVQTDVYKWYSAFDCFILPSIFEGLPFVGIEAQAAGLPCLFSKNVTNEIKLTEKAIFLQIEKEKEWGEKIKDIKISYEERIEINTILQHSIYSISEMSYKLLTIYKKINES